jgi:serine protease AprX
LSVYNQAIGANKLWSEGYQGSSVTVAVVDSGIVDSNDFKQTYGGGGDQRILTTATIVDGNDEYKDWYGHGTHVAGIIGGNGTLSQGRYIGVAPKVELVAVDVANETGEATTSDIIAGLQWINDNKDAYNIRVVNMSINSSVAESYHTSPLNAAVEILWFNGIVVVVSAGNNGSSGNGILYPPANDPFVITVGAVDDKGTASIGDDTLAAFSAYGITESGVSKPDLVAPGKNIISVLSKQDTALAVGHPNNKVYTFSGSQDLYFRMSGTSMSSAVVTGAVALLLQDEPNLTPDQVKYRLIATGQAFDAGNDAPYLDIYAAVKGATTESANNGNLVSAFLWLDMGLFLETSANWNSANWNSANWNSANWNSANWNSANWNSANWNSANWNSANWNSANWNSANWNSANWNSANWNSANWNSDDWGD